MKLQALREDLRAGQTIDLAMLWGGDGHNRNDGHTNIASPFNEGERRAPLEDTLTVANGFIGTHPNAFYVVERARLAEFVQQFAALRSAAHYAVLQAAFGPRRTDTDFWPTSDHLAQLYRQGWPAEAGLFDLNRYENR